MQRSALCRSRRELSNAYLLAKFGFDTAENEPCQVCPIPRSAAASGRRRGRGRRSTARRRWTGSSRRSRTARRRTRRRRRGSSSTRASPRPPRRRWVKCIFRKCIFQKFCKFLAGSFSAESKRNFARKYAFDSIFQAL